MSLRNAAPKKFAPAGLSDAVDETQAFPGACLALTNLIPDPVQNNTWVPRPAALKISSFAGFTAPGLISVMKVIGNYALGMIASSRNPGFDEPFVFNIPGQSFVTVTNVLSSNVPNTVANGGAGVAPPCMSMVGPRLIVTHPGFAGTANFFGWFDLSTPGAAAWNAGNTTGTVLPAVPSAVATFSDRAYFAVNIAAGYASVYFTDVGTLNLSFSTQIITFGDNSPIVAMASMPYNNILGGIIQSLLVFKGSANGLYNIYQVTGDASQTQTTTISTGTTQTQVLTSTLTQNALNCNTTTLYPNSIAITAKGLMFVSPDGLRIIDWQSQISDPIGANGQGVNAPFLVAGLSNYIAAAAIASVYRVSLTNNAALGTPIQEFWYDIVRKKWSGPHTLPMQVIASYGNTFICQPVGQPGTLWQSDAEVSATSTFTEGVTALAVQLTTSMLADDEGMEEKSMVETNLLAGLLSGQQITVAAQDETNSSIGTFIYSASGSATIWGAFNWGAANWGGSINTYRPRRLDWGVPLVYRRISFNISGMATSGLRLGEILLREQRLGYIQQFA